MENIKTARVNTITLLLAFALFLVSFSALAASNTDITGRWVTIDDATGKKRSIVEITERDGKIYGQIAKVFFEPGDNRECVECKGEKHNQPIVGLEIIDGLTLDENTWSGGTILDPKNGKEYDCTLWLEGDDLKVRGYLFLFFRTQTWKRYQPAQELVQDGRKG